jgi:short-subunit dehydrogenase
MTKQKILIIGATSGMGRKIAELYAEKGHRVGISGRRLELLQEIKQQSPKQVEYECFDVTKSENITHLEALVNKLGGLDILIISAGNGEPSKELSWKIDKTTVDTNVNGFVEIANWSFNYFLKQGYGQLATISSIGAIRGGSWAPAYNASKAFQSSYFEGLAIKARRLKNPSTGSGMNISVTCIEPGFVDTPMAKGRNKMFWIVPVEKAARQIIKAIEKRKRKVYISRRWWLIAKILKWAPFWLYKRFG